MRCLHERPVFEHRDHVMLLTVASSSLMRLLAEVPAAMIQIYRLAAVAIVLLCNADRWLVLAVVQEHLATSL